jgi:hypothetical protein
VRKAPRDLLTTIPFFQSCTDGARNHKIARQHPKIHGGDRFRLESGVLAELSRSQLNFGLSVNSKHLFYGFNRLSDVEATKPDFGLYEARPLINYLVSWAKNMSARKLSEKHRHLGSLPLCHLLTMYLA